MAQKNILKMWMLSRRNENIFIFQEDKKSKKLTDEEIEKLGLFER